MGPLDNATSVLLPEIAPFFLRTQNASSTFCMVLVRTRTVNNRKYTEVANTSAMHASPSESFYFSENTSLLFLH